MKNEKGFSLVELMVVVAIIGILAAIAIPNYQKFQRKAQQVEAKTMMSGLYANQITFLNEWNYLSASFKQIGFEAIGDVPKYNVGWSEDSRTPFSMPISFDRGFGYRGPKLENEGQIGNELVNTAGGSIPNGCREPTYCDEDALKQAFSHNESYDVTNHGAGTCSINDCGCAGGVATCSSSGTCPAGCGFMLDGVLDKRGRSFVIGAAGDIGGDQSDLWYMDYKKVIENVKSGL